MHKFQFKKQRKHKKFSWMTLVFPLLAFMVLAVGVTSLLTYKWYNDQLLAVDTLESSVPVVIAPGVSSKEIGELLERKGVIRSKTAFYWYVRLNMQQNSFQAGSYLVNPDENVETIVNKIIAGDVSVELFTILPAKRIDQLKAAFVTAGFTRDEVNEGFNPKLYANHPARKYAPHEADLEGYIYPESFQLASDATVSEIINRSLDELDEVLTADLRSALAEQGLTVHQALIMASIVENEVSNSTDRSIVAQVFLKRYREGISLGADPTAVYGSLLEGVEPSVFVDSPYNTRIYNGLPPGPISNVSLSSLNALANPADSEFLFFVAGDDGKTYFSYTVVEHEALTAEHCFELCQ